MKRESLITNFQKEVRSSGKNSPQHINHRVQEFYFCVCICCRVDVFTEPLPSNIRKGSGTGTQTECSHKPLLFFQNKGSRLNLRIHAPMNSATDVFYDVREQDDVAVRLQICMSDIRFESASSH
jgi:hypothetical protein